MKACAAVACSLLVATALSDRAGAQTLGDILRALEGSTRQAAPQAQPRSQRAGPSAEKRATVREAQSLLNALGFDAGPEDGLMGPRTRAAIVEFQRNYGQQATGTLDDRTLRALASAALGSGLVSPPQPRDQGRTESAEPAHSTSEPSSKRPSGQRGTITILGLEMPEPVPFEIPVSWELVRDDIPAELLRKPDKPMTRSEVHSHVAQVAARHKQEFERALDLLVNVVLVSNPDWADGNLDLYLMDWLADLGAGEGIGDMSSSIELSNGIVITPEAQILVQRLEIDRVYRRRDAVEAILESFVYGPMAEEAPASPTIAERNDEQAAVPVEADTATAPLRIGPVSEDLDVAISENWARRSAEALGKGRKREAILSALKGIPEGAGDARLDTEFHPAHLALYTAMRADIIRFPYSSKEFLRAPVSASPARDRLVVGAKQRGPQREDHWFPDWIEFWDTDAQEIIAEWRDDFLFDKMHHVERARFDVAGKHFAIMGDDGRAHVFDAGTGRHLGSSEPIAPPMSDTDGVQIQSLDLSPSGRYVFASSRFTSGLKVWDRETMSPLLSWNADDIRRIVGGTSRYAYATGHFIDDDTLCLLAIGERPSPPFAHGIVAGLLDFRSGRFDEIFRREQKGYNAKVECSPRSQWLALRHVGIQDLQSSSFQTLEMVDMASGAVVHAINDVSAANHLSFNADESLVALFGLHGWTFYDLRSGEFVRQPGTVRDFQLGHARFFDAITDDPIHTFAVQLSAFTTDRVWDRVPVGADLVTAAIAVLTGEERAELDRERVAVAAEEDDRRPHDRLAVISENWARRSSELLDEGHRTEAVMAALKGLPAQPDESELAAFAPAHLALYTAFRANYVRLPLAERISLHGAVISPDRSRALTIMQKPDGGRHFELWDGREGERISTLFVETSSLAVPEMALSRDARWAAVDNYDNTLRLHSAIDGRLHAEFTFPPPRHRGDFDRIEMEFSPGSEYLAASAAGLLKVWRLPGGEPVVTLPNAGMSMGFANDSHLCASAGSDRSPSLVIVDAADGTITNTYRFEHLDNYRGGAWQVRCSPDLRMATVGYSSIPPNSTQHVKHMHLFALERETRKIADLDTHRIFTPVFDPSSRYIAADMEMGTPRHVYDIELGEFVEHPTAMKGFGGPWTGLFNTSDDVRLIGAAVLPDAANIWEEAPRGQALIDAALAGLGREQRDEVDEMRLK